MTHENKQFTDMAFEIEGLKEEVAHQTREKNSAYNERNCLVALLAHMLPSGIRKTAIENWEPEWHNCVYIDTPAGQMSWHYHDSEAMAFADLPDYTKEWDGHTTAEKYERMGRLQQMDLMTTITTAYTKETKS
jgi:hypothetical protein